MKIIKSLDFLYLMSYRHNLATDKNSIWAAKYISCLIVGFFVFGLICTVLSLISQHLFNLDNFSGKILSILYKVPAGSSSSFVLFGLPLSWTFLYIFFYRRTSKIEMYFQKVSFPKYWRYALVSLPLCVLFFMLGMYSKIDPGFAIKWQVAIFSIGEFIFRGWLKRRESS